MSKRLCLKVSRSNNQALRTYTGFSFSSWKELHYQPPLDHRQHRKSWVSIFSILAKLLIGQKKFVAWSTSFPTDWSMNVKIGSSLPIELAVPGRVLRYDSYKLLIIFLGRFISAALYRKHRARQWTNVSHWFDWIYIFFWFAGKIDTLILDKTEEINQDSLSILYRFLPI